MFTGTTIEELINSVERAEQHAREENHQARRVSLIWVEETELQELVEVT